MENQKKHVQNSNASNNSPKVNIRELILDMLIEIYADREYSHILLRNVLEKYNYLDQKDKSFMKRVCEGCVERKIQLDYVINQFSNIQVNKMKPLIRALLRMSVYQLLFMDTVPDSAVCNEAVKLAQKRKFTALKGFVNGVLRTISREKEQIKYPDKSKNYKEYLSVTYSMPMWIVEHWFNEKRDVESILEGLLKEHPVTIRINNNLTPDQKTELLEELVKQQIQVERHEYLEDAYELKNTGGLNNIQAFLEGKITVQDVSSMFVAKIANPEKGAQCIDVCAAPGGKAIHLAEMVGIEGHVEARDLNDYKTDMINENIKRMKASNVSTLVFDATDLDESAVGTADVVIADVPCSGLGVIGKKRDIKYHATPESLKEIVTLQKKIITNAQAYVKPQGILMYSTCTINRGENEEMVEWICKNYPFEPVCIQSFLPQQLQDEKMSESAKNGYFQFLPDKTDGFFIAKLQKKAESLPK